MKAGGDCEGNAISVLADQVADHTVALLTGLLRSLPTFFRAQQRREFVRRPTRDLHRARIGIIGLGRNGRRLAETVLSRRNAVDGFERILYVADQSRSPISRRTASASRALTASLTS